MTDLIGQEARRLLSDLDRCEHGRHSTDGCGWCPGGMSTGNLLLPPGTVIGHGIGGRPIVVPEADGLADPVAWRRSR
jgi:hypothetical protein